jgi:O-antigen ligase
MWFVALRFLIPSPLVVAPLANAGSPATLFGVAMLAIWAIGRCLPGSGLARGLQPVRIGIALFVATAAASYVSSFQRYLLANEVRAADRALIWLAAFVGVAFLAADGLHSTQAIRRVARFTVTLGTLVGAIGVTQFFTGLDIRPWYKIPGLSTNVGLYGHEQRAAFRRVMATGTHPIEFGVLMALLLPLAVHFALHPDGPARRRRWIPVLVIGAAIPMSLSRSAIIGTLAAGIVLLTAWDARRRVNALAAVAAFTLAMRLLVPGLIGTLRGLFTNLTSDSSYQARVNRYPVAFGLVHERPWLGRGFGTLLPENWPGIVPLDNQWLATAVETGVLGFSALIVMFLVGFWTARGAARRFRTTDPAAGHLANAVAASILAAFAAYPTFDALGYPMLTGTIALFLGLTGASWRLSRAADP